MRVCRQVLFQRDLFTSSVEMLAFVEGLGDLKDILGDSDPSKSQFTAKEFGFYVPGHQFKGRKQAIAKDEDVAVMNGLYESCSARSSVYLFYRLNKDNRNFSGRRSMKLPSQLLSPSLVDVAGISSSHDTSAVDGAAQDPETPQSDSKGQSLLRAKRRLEEVGAVKRVSLDERQTVQSDIALEPARKLLMTRPAYWTGNSTAQLINVSVDGDDSGHENLFTQFKATPTASPVAQIRQKMEVRGGLLSQLKLIQDMTSGEVAAPSAVFKKAADGVMEDLQELEKIGVAGAQARAGAAEPLAAQSGVSEMDNSLGSVVIVQTGNEETTFY